MSKTVSAALISVAVVFAAVPVSAIVTWHDQAAPKALLADTGTVTQNSSGHLGVSAYRAAADRLTNAASATTLR
jgi:hypothetical protein